MIGYKPDGKPNRKSFYGHSRTEAFDKFIAYRVSEENKKSETVSFAAFANEWYESHEDNVQASTYANYKYTLNSLIKEFGKTDISAIKAKDIETFLKAEKKAKKSDSKISKERAMLSQIMNRAVANDIIDKNPVSYVVKMRSDGPKKEKGIFTKEEMHILFHELPDDSYGNMIRLMLATGVRLQELLALEPKHLDVEKRKVYIRQAIKNVNGHIEIGPPKSSSSYRDIAVPESLIPVMKKLKNTNFQYISQRIPDAGPCTEQTFRKIFKKYLSSLHVTVLTPHCCRHTYVSQMRAIGIAIETIQSFVGHSDTDMTKHYLHVQDSIKIAAADEFEKAFLL